MIAACCFGFVLLVLFLLFGVALLFLLCLCGVFEFGGVFTCCLECKFVVDCVAVWIVTCLCLVVIFWVDGFTWVGLLGALWYLD